MPTHSERLQAQCEAMAQTLVEEISPRIEAILKLARMERAGRGDGYPRSSMNGSVRGGDVARPTETAVTGPPCDCEEGKCPHVAPIDRPPSESDIVAVWVEEALDRLRELGKLITQEADLTSLIVNRGDKRYGRQATGDYCDACARFVTGAVDDKLKRGYCAACYRAWLRFVDTEIGEGREASPVRFKNQRKKEEVA